MIDIKKEKNGNYIIYQSEFGSIMIPLACIKVEEGIQLNIDEIKKNIDSWVVASDTVSS